MNEELHDCSKHLPCDDCGPALDHCFEKEDQTLWVENGKYASQVNFCPYCGYEAKKKAKITNEYQSH